MSKPEPVELGYDFGTWGREYRTWQAKMKVAVSNILTRQQKRAMTRMAVWKRMSWNQALLDDRGIIPRRVRRSIWRAQVKQLGVRVK